MDDNENDDDSLEDVVLKVLCQAMNLTDFCHSNSTHDNEVIDYLINKFSKIFKSFGMKTDYKRV